MKLLEFKTAYNYTAFVDVDEVISASYYNGILSIVFKNGQKMDYHMSQYNARKRNDKKYKT